MTLGFASLEACWQVAHAASKGVFVQDLLLAGRLSTNTTIGYEAISHALRELLDSGYIVIHEGKLGLGILTTSGWLESALIEGDDLAWALSDLFPKSQRKFKPDQDLLQTIGLNGEKFVLQEYESSLAPALKNRIRHVSLLDDSAGYDIVVPSSFYPHENLFLEIKTSVRPGDSFNFFLSRNEAQKALQVGNWHLVLVNLSGPGAIFGHLEGASMGSYFPSDGDSKFEWQSVRGTLSKEDVRLGLPGLSFQ